MMKWSWMVLLLFYNETFSQPAVNKKEYGRRMAIIQKNITRFFYDSSTHRYKEFNQRDSSDKNTWSYLWPLCGLIQAANEVEAGGNDKGFTQNVLRHIQEYNDTAPPTPGYNAYLPAVKKEERFYDDNQWIGIACMDAFFRTKDQQFLQEGMKAYRFMMTGFDTAGGGGLYWKEGDFTTKNTCSNGPGILLALQLYKATGNKNFLDTARLLYSWTNKHLLSSQGVYYDHVMLPSRNIDKRCYTYNTGTMLQANVLLYEILKNKEYLSEAKRLATSAYKFFYKNNRWPENYWFNAVLLRGYLQLSKHDSNKLFISSFMRDANRTWKEETDHNKLVGPHPKKHLLDQAAVLEIYARLLLY